MSYITHKIPFDVRRSDLQQMLGAEDQNVRIESQRLHLALGRVSVDRRHITLHYAVLC